MAHSNNIISSIKLPGNDMVYEIHDAHAIHNIEDLGLASVMQFKGTKTTESAITGLTSAKVGDVWLCTGNNTEYVCTTAISGTANASAWEKLGNVHDAAASNHTHGVTVTGTNSASEVTGTVTIPTVSKTQKYLTAAASAPIVTPSKVTITASASGTAVASNGTASAITGFGTHTTNSALGTDATFAVTGGDASTSKMVTSTASKVTISNKSIPNVTANTEVKASKVSSAGSKTNGTAASWSASVTDGVLSFSWTANTPTAVTLPTFTEVTATNTTLGTAISASSVSASDVTVATGALASTGTGASVVTGVSDISVAVDNADAVSAITALGTPITKTVLTGVKVSAQPTITVTNGTDVLTGVTVGAPTITLTNNDSNVTGAVPVVSAVTIGSASASLTNGSAAAQTWTQKSGTTGVPQ